MTNIHNHKILILDFGSQYTQLIARRVREIGVYCELWAWDVTEEQIREFNPDGIILSDELSMEIYNADGSYAQMCGNGIRCYAKYCYDEGICRDTSYDLTCGKQKIPIQILSLDPFMVNVNMGIPLYDADAIGVRKDLYRLPYPFLMKDGTVLKE